MAGKLPGNPSQDKTAKETPNVYMDGIDHEVESQLRKLYCSFLQELGIELKVPQLTIATAMMLCHRFYTRQSHAKNDWQTIATVSMFLSCKAEETLRWLGDVAVVAYKLMYSWDASAPRRIRQRDVYDKQKELILTGERLVLSTVAFDLNIEHPYKPIVAALKRLEISHKELAKVAWNFVNDWLCMTLCLRYKPHYIAAASTFLAAKFQKVKLPTERGNMWWMQFDISPKLLEEVIQQMKRALPPMHGKVIESKPAVVKMTNVPQSGIVSGSNFAQNNGHGATVDTGRLVKSAMSNSLQSCIKSGLNVTDHTAHGALVDAGGLVESAISSGPQSCIINSSNVAQDTGHGAMVDSGGLIKSAMSKCSENEASSDFHVHMLESLRCQTSDCSSANGAVEDGDVEPRSGESDRNSSSKIVSVQVGDSKINVDRIKEALKRRRWDRISNKQKPWRMR